MNKGILRRLSAAACCALVSAAHAGTLNYEYDELNRLVSVTEDGRQTRYAYDAVGNRQRISHPNNVTTVYGYDSMNRLMRVTHETTSAQQVLAQYIYTLNAVGQRTQVEEKSAVGTQRIVAYTYDGLRRLTQEQVQERDGVQLQVTRTTSYSYDRTGNRLTKSLNGAQTSYAYDANDHLLTETTGNIVIAYGYDDNGNTIRRETKAGGATIEVMLYAYDNENRLLQVKQGSSEAGATAISSNSYDADGNRVQSTANGVTTTHLVDTNQRFPQVLEETAGGQVTRYVRYDELVAQIRNGEKHYYHTDALGSVRFLTDAAGSITDRFTYDAFGELIARTGSTPINFLFAGEQIDSATGLYYLRSRWMEPKIGRFVSRDTYQPCQYCVASLHKYVYASGDPVNRIDPTGKENLLSLSTALTGGSVLYTSYSVTSDLKAGELGAALFHATVGLLLGTGGQITRLIEADAAAAAKLGINPKIYEQLAKQLERDGPKSVGKALRSAEKTLKEHKAKLEQLSKDGGFTSQVEATIENVERQIATLRQFIRDQRL
jgi:RHS repeat-associated protein